MTAFKKNRIADTVTGIIGADIGHGETALTIARMGSDTQAEPEKLKLFGMSNQITAIAYTEDGHIIIGEHACELPEVKELDIAFKRRPDANADYRRLMRDYLTAIHSHLLETKQIENTASVHYFIGCPSGWSEKERADYEALFQETGITQITVGKESHAALIHAKESGLLTLNELQDALLIVDIGSSTTDLTFSLNRQTDSLSEGYDLGGAMLDGAILREMLAHQEARAEIEVMLNGRPVRKNQCLVACRKAKEACFAHPERYTQSPFLFSVKLAKGLYFEVELSAEQMMHIVQSPLPELQGRTWEQAFHDALVKACGDWAKPHSLTKGSIIATGGASRMTFVAAACRETFPEWKFKLSADPEFTIANGLARWGRVLARTQGFDGDMEELLNNEIAKILEAEAPKLIEQLITRFTAAMKTSVIERGLKDWRSGRVKRLNDLRDHMEKLAKDWARSCSKALVTSEIETWLKTVYEHINQAIQVICRRYGLPGSAARAKSTDISVPDVPVDIPLLDPANLTALLDNILMALIAAIVVISIALAHVTFGMGFIAAAIVTFGRAYAEDRLRQWDMPTGIREKLVSDAEIEKQSKACAAKIETETRKAFGEQSGFKQIVTNSILQPLRETLQNRIDEARTLIK